jgi:spore coat polysaccharide biosynthesis protein SpsF
VAFPERLIALRIVAVVQARMGSTRLPGKVLADIEGRPMLERVLARLERARSVDDVVVATSTSSSDDIVAALCEELEVTVFRGSEEDVLDRYVGAARAAEADAVARITADCPLIDPSLVESVAAAFLAANADFAANTIERSFPRGLDVEVARMSALETAWREATLPHQRSHVMPFIYEHPERFALVSVRAPEDHSALRWTVDTPEDLAVMRAVYGRLADPFAGWLDVLELFELDPSLPDINRGVSQKEIAEG